MSDDATFVADFLKTHDRDRYLSTLVLSEPKRTAVQALYAFSADVAVIPARVSEPGPGEIRLQWWKDALEGVSHGGVSQNPIAAALLKVIAEYSLPAGPLVRLIAARRFDLYQDPMPDMDTFEGYAGEVNSTLYQFAAMILNDGAPLEDGDAAGHLGVAHALIGHLRALAYNAGRGRIFLPWSIFAANGITEQQLFAGQETEKLHTAFTQLMDIAADHLKATRAAITRQPKKLRPAFAMLPMLEAQLQRLKKADSALKASVNIPDWQNILRVTFWAMRNA